MEKYFANMVVVESSKYALDEVTKTIVEYLESIRAKDITYFKGEQNDKVYIHFEIVNQHLVDVVEVVIKKYEDIEYISCNFCPKMIFGYSVGYISYRGNNKEFIHRKLLEDGYKNSYEFSAFINQVSLEEAGFVYDEEKHNYRLLNLEDQQKRIEDQEKFDQYLSDLYLCLCLHETIDEPFGYIPIEKRDLTLDDDIGELDLQVRPYNCLKRAGVNTIEELIGLTKEEVLQFRNLNENALENILEQLSKIGLKLKE